jgi:hypothetical protein
MENGLSYFIRMIRSSEEPELFKSFNQVRVTKWGGQKIRIGKFPTYNSFEQYIYTCFAQALESGELFKAARCPRKGCGKFILGERTNKKFCSDKCRWTYNNGREDRKLERKIIAYEQDIRSSIRKRAAVRDAAKNPTQRVSENGPKHGGQLVPI